MSVDKIFIKSFLNNFEEESFSVKLWDEEEIKVGQDEPLFKVTLNKPIPKKELLSSATLAFGEAYMDGNLQVEGDFLTMLNTVLKYKSKFPTDFKGLPKIFSNLTSQKKQKEEVSVAASIANSSAQDKRNAKQGSHYNHPEPDSDQDFSIHSVEEARRAIIWGEILQRKY